MPLLLPAAGAVFEASLPPDLAAMYRQLAVLLPQAPVPLVTVLQLWGITDPQEAQETVQIFVMQVGHAEPLVAQRVVHCFWPL